MSHIPLETQARARNFLKLHQRIDCIDDELAQDQLIARLQHPRQPFIISFVNAHAANLAWVTPAVHTTLLHSDLLLRDGIGLELSLAAFGFRRGLNMNGTDFIPRVVEAYAGRRAALFGTRSPWLDIAKERLESAGLVVVACHHGYASPEAYLKLVATTEPELIILAMGMPKQEYLALRLREELRHPALVVNGGAVLDFLGGKVSRAPKVMRIVGAEWVYRLFLEPRRLARRYLLGIPLFLWHVALTRVICHEHVHQLG